MAQREIKGHGQQCVLGLPCATELREPVENADLSTLLPEMHISGLRRGPGVGIKRANLRRL